MTEFPALTDYPVAAISVGFINFGAQVGCRYTDPVTVAEYLKGAANIIAPAH